MRGYHNNLRKTHMLELIGGTFVLRTVLQNAPFPDTFKVLICRKLQFEFMYKKSINFTWNQDLTYASTILMMLHKTSYSHLVAMDKRLRVNIKVVHKIILCRNDR